MSRSVNFTLLCGAEIHVGLGPQEVSVQIKKKEGPIRVPGTSIRSVATLTGVGINTHTHMSGEGVKVIPHPKCLSTCEGLQVDAIT